MQGFHGISHSRDRRVKERHPLGTRAFEGVQEAHFGRFAAQSARSASIFHWFLQHGSKRRRIADASLQEPFVKNE